MARKIQNIGIIENGIRHLNFQKSSFGLGRPQFLRLFYLKNSQCLIVQSEVGYLIVHASILVNQ